ncbi:MAG: PEP-CTERM sorting domain-containing protein [Candidatus Saccharibacteria bacterium]|nr:PEP-CTERM sorting domain-containing protein [Rhodoferax sp.]
MFGKVTMLVSALLLAATAQAAPIVLDFEGIGDITPVGNFYNGGAGKNYGVSFSSATFALVDADAGGGGNFANEQSPNTIMYVEDIGDGFLNFAAGFDTGFSFFYTSSTMDAGVSVYDNVDGTGNLLASLDLTPQFTNNCNGDPSGTFCNWTAVGVGFNGIAKSIYFGGSAGQIGFDDITLGSVTAGDVGNVPEPASLLLSGAALLALLATRRRKL